MWRMAGRKNNKICIIATLHFILACHGFVLTILDMIGEQYPITLHEILYVLGFYFGHFFLIFLVWYGTSKKIYLLQVPWLSVTFTLFSMASILTLKNLVNFRFCYLGDYCINCLYLVVCWYIWITVFRSFKNNIETSSGSKILYKKLLSPQ